MRPLRLEKHEVPAASPWPIDRYSAAAWCKRMPLANVGAMLVVGVACRAAGPVTQVQAGRRRPPPPASTLGTVKSDASAALVRSFYRALRLARCMHRHHLSNLFTAGCSVGLGLQRKLLRIQRPGGRRRFDRGLWLLHGGLEWFEGCGVVDPARTISTFAKAPAPQLAAFLNSRWQSQPAQRCRRAACRDRRRGDV